MRAQANVADVSSLTYPIHSASDLCRLSAKFIKSSSNPQR